MRIPVRSSASIFATALAVVLPLQAADVRSAAAKSVSLVQKGLQGFYTKQDCFSCHHAGLPAQVIQLARERGIGVDEASARTAITKSLSAAPNLGSIDQSLQANRIIDPAAVESAALLAAHAAGMKPSLATALTVRLIAGQQRADGHWPTLDARPPEGESAIAATAISARAMRLYAPPEMAKQIESQVLLAREWLKRITPHSTEEFAYRLAGLAWSGADMATRSAAARDLLALQRPSGGWGQLPYREPDAYATGQALVMLHEAGDIPVTDSNWKRGLGFLLATQASDGSWQVHSRQVSPAAVSPPYFETGSPYGHDQFISGAATSWAAMALMLSFPGARTQPLGLPGLALKDEQPWMRTAALGTVAELKARLDKGLDPNSATPGGSSVLMLAAPDKDKIRLLLDRGADPNRRARSGHTALMTASLHRASSDALRLLLAAGAQAKLTGVQFNASPLMFATFAGDTSMMNLLLTAGADVNRPMLLGGTGPMSPLALAMNLDEPESMRALLAAGANSREKDGDGLGLMAYAAMANRIEPARVLLAAGVDVNNVDKFGFTPLLYAATIDYGDDRMVKLLLNAGARADAKGKNGETPLSQAKRLGFPHIQSALATPGAAR